MMTCCLTLEQYLLAKDTVLLNSVVVSGSVGQCCCSATKKIISLDLIIGYSDCFLGSVEFIET